MLSLHPIPSPPAPLLSPKSSQCAIVSISLLPPLSFMLSHMLRMPRYCDCNIYSVVSILLAKKSQLSYTEVMSHREKTVRKSRWQQPPPRNICRRVFVILMPPEFSHSFAFDLVFFLPLDILYFIVLSL